MSAAGRPRLCRVLVGRAVPLLLALIGLVALPTSPAAADVPPVPPVQLTLSSNGGDPQPFFVGDELTATSQVFSLEQRNAYHCTVDFGDGDVEAGFWQGKPGNPAPCASFHRYAMAGAYAVTMTITGPDASSQSDSQDVTVRPRPVTTLDPVVEGTRVLLTAPDGATNVVFTSVDAYHCVLSNQHGSSATATCIDQGDYSFIYAAQRGGEPISGQFDLTVVNGAPQPTVRAFTNRPDGEQRATRVGTGDQVTFQVRAHDPSFVSDRLGSDLVTCRFNYGNGRHEVVPDSDYDSCEGHLAYPEPGTYTTNITVTDKDGASATTSTSVKVVRRDIHASATGDDPKNLSGTATGALVDGRITGHLHFRLADGREFDVPHLTSVALVFPGDVQLSGPIRIDGVAYRATADLQPSSRTPVAFFIESHDGHSAPAYAYGRRGYFDVKLDAPPLR